MKDLEKNVGLMAAHHNHHLEDYNKLTLLVVNIQERMGQMSDTGHMSSVLSSLLDERFAKMKMDLHEKSMVTILSFNKMLS